MGFLGSTLDVRVTVAQQQLARRADSRAEQTEIRRRVEQARVPPAPGR
jgi:hypothetical protein